MKKIIKIRNLIKEKLIQNKLFHKDVAHMFTMRHFKNPDKNKISKLKKMVNRGENVEHLIIALEPSINKAVQIFYRYEDQIDEIATFYKQVKETFLKYEKFIHFKIYRHQLSKFYEHEDLFQDMYMVLLKTFATYNLKHAFSTQLGRNIDFELNNKYRERKHEIHSTVLPIYEEYIELVGYKNDPYPIEKDLMMVAESIKEFRPLHLLIVREMIINGKKGSDIEREYGIPQGTVMQYKKIVLNTLQNNKSIKELLNKEN